MTGVQTCALPICTLEILHGIGLAVGLAGFDCRVADVQDHEKEPVRKTLLADEKMKQISAMQLTLMRSVLSVGTRSDAMERDI